MVSCGVFFYSKQTKVMFKFTVTHHNAFCVAKMSKDIKSCIVYICVCDMVEVCLWDNLPEIPLKVMHETSVVSFVLG